MKKVSVIIPFYSHIEWLYEAVESVLAQTYSNFEIIIVNDGSKEDMTDFLGKYGNRIIYRYQNNAGPAAARNLGLSIASGEYVAFEDSDDIWFPTKLEKQIAFMEKSGAEWSHTGSYYWWPTINRLQQVDSSRDYDDVFLQRLVSTKIATPAVVINRKILVDNEDFIFPENCRNGEDGILYTKIARRYPIALIQEPLIKIRIRGTNSQGKAVERFNWRSAIYNELILDGQDYPAVIIFIYRIYSLYSMLFGTNTSPFKEFVAKVFWTIPYVIERLYVHYLYQHTSKKENYILRY